MQSVVKVVSSEACAERSSAEVAPTARRFASLDALRGIAAMSVVLFHANEGGHVTELVQRMPPVLALALAHGNLGVSIFFVLSGFVIAHSLHSVRVDGSAAVRFMIRRTLRLSPPYWAAIVIAVGFAILSVRFVPGKAEPDLSFGRLAAHFFYVQEMLGYAEINPVFWTLCQEVQFYLVYAIILLVGADAPSARLQRSSRTVALLALAGVVSALWPLGLVQQGPWKASFLPLWHTFLLGVASYWCWRNRAFLPWVACYLLVIAASAVLRGNAFSLAACVTAVLIFLASSSETVAAWLRWRSLQFLGLVSYSLYLVHNPVTGAVFRAGTMLSGRTAALEAAWWAASIAACVAAAAILHRLVEKPSIALARRITLKTDQA